MLSGLRGYSEDMGKILILGASGMLGSQVHRYFQREEIPCLGTIRESSSVSPQEGYLPLTVEGYSEQFFSNLGQVDWVINCLGIIKSRIVSGEDKSLATRVNSLFPHELNESAEKLGFKVIQIATDCVYSGQTGQYTEDSPHSPTDVYGMSKSLGEVDSEHFMNLRCSIIGPELNGNSSLLEWVRSQPSASEIPGFVNHIWNGISTLAFAKIAAGIVKNDGFRSGTFHVIPRDVVTKDQLVRLLAKRLDRDDLIITPVTATKLVERSLKTNFPEVNAELWKNANYPETPSIQELVEECPID